MSAAPTTTTTEAPASSNQCYESPLPVSEEEKEYYALEEGEAFVAATAAGTTKTGKQGSHVSKRYHIYTIVCHSLDASS